MGCFSSKVMTRSSSFQEEMNQSLQRRNKGFPSVLEELLISRNGGDQFLALVCSANKKLQVGSFTSESSTHVKPSDRPIHLETINTWELMADLEEQQQQSPLRVERSIDASRQSKSFHWSPDHKFSMEQSIDGDKEHDSNGDNKGITRSRSFHTVEEYDAIVERNWWFKAREVRLEDSVTNTKLRTIYTYEALPMTCPNIEEVKSEIEGKDKTYCGEEDSVKDESVIEHGGSLKANKLDNLEIEATNLFVSCCSSSATEVMDVVEDVSIEGNVTNEKGLRRKAVAKELTSLTIPSTIEFPTIGGLRDQVEVEGQAYVTPKFGTIGLPVSMHKGKCSDGSVFDPEMLLAFEEAMQQLEVEEKHILKQIADNLEEKIEEEEISPHIGE